MDSLTQIVLGASIGEAVLGHKIGNKAILYGAIGGTIPDLDIFASSFTNTVSALTIHRGFTHSILFSIVFAPIFAWLVTRYESYKNLKAWRWFFFWVFVTHPMLDSFTTWGTQLFWPFDFRLALKNIFVLDPLYTLPFLICLILTMFQKKTSKKRGFYNNLGLIISSSYLVLTLLLKGITFHKFKNALNEQNIAYHKIDTRPSALNTILWNANVETEDNYLLGSYSFFDKQTIRFESYSKNHDLIKCLRDNNKVKQMIEITKGWFTITKKDSELYFNDLRFGTLSMNPNVQDFVFQYKILVNSKGEVNFVETEKDRSDAKKLISDLWLRIMGL